MCSGGRIGPSRVGLSQSWNRIGGSYCVGIQPSEAMNIKTDALDAKCGVVAVKTGVEVRAVSP
jgi:hypothetical protein